jgi:hypothetical protein
MNFKNDAAPSALDSEEFARTLLLLPRLADVDIPNCADSLIEGSIRARSTDSCFENNSHVA